MTDAASAPSQPNSAIPADDPNRKLTVADPDSSKVRHVAVVGGTYSILVSGAQTAGRYCLIDMIVPDGGGPPLHRHDFEEMFTVLDGKIEITFRESKSVLRAGETGSIPSNAPHQFKNVSERPARLLCLCSPAGMEEFFAPLASRSRHERPPAPNSTNPAGRHSRKSPKRWRRSIGRSCCLRRHYESVHREHT